MDHGWRRHLVRCVDVGRGRQRSPPPDQGQAVAGIVVVLATLWASDVLIQSHSLAGAAAASVIGSTVGLIAFAAIFLTIGKPLAGRGVVTAKNSRRRDEPLERRADDARVRGAG